MTTARPDPSTLIIDLRAQELRFRDPLERLLPNPVRAVSLDRIEAGEHGLNADLGPLLIVCDHGPRSSLAAQYLRADGLDARAYPGGLSALKRALQTPAP
ncbi:rhodanese-like domain-containing protein [Deinococcus maricopensis]|uniref:Putative rhodanese sulfurtransferase n=1 Tax=Deinococcus maricopensis (strain DSM 21211 / LMG 22137 / NRRL B-23946 / LB-34) TaxID=709986 RepID=E8U7M1_DEIML|nr:rhodanese-like domain-containing protein [Deinococcus maricopensis]ADV67060.1 putative rhodanese sulfurtransferase [Deinococcus maricopensis DSM 21211]